MTRHITVPAHAYIASRETIRTDDMHSYFDRAYTWAVDAMRPAGVGPAGPARAYYYSPLTETVDVAAGFPVSDDDALVMDAENPELVHRVPEYEVVTSRHHGSYDTLGQAWQELTEYVRSTGRTTGPVFWEEYVTMPGPDTDPAETVTDLYVTLV